MGGIEFRIGTLVGRPPHKPDDRSIGFTDILDRFGIDHVYVTGYVAIRGSGALDGRYHCSRRAD